MSEFESGSKGLKVTKFSSWTESEKLHKSGKNAFKVFRKLKKQLKAEAYSGKATSIEQYPAVPYVVKFPTDSSWTPIDPITNTPVSLTNTIQYNTIQYKKS